MRLTHNAQRDDAEHPLEQRFRKALSPRSRMIMTYAMCGFANPGSLGIMIGGMTALCPERTADILRLAPRSLWSGLLATCMTGTVIGLIA